VKQYSDVVITGAIAYDEIMDFPGLFVDYFHPEKLHQINVSFTVTNLEKQIGGTGLNIAYNIGLLIKNQNQVKLIGAIGKDGRTIINFCKKNNINIQGIFIDKKLYTASGKVITDIKDNQIWGFYNGASKEGKKIDLEKNINNNSLLIIAPSHQEVFLKHQNQAIKLGIEYLYDPGMILTWIKDSDLKKGILNCQWLVGNDYEISMILKRLDLTINSLIEKNKNIIITLGDQGVNYFSKKEKFHLPAFKIKKVVDPTGAGDAWRGGFVSGLMLGKTIKESLKLGNVIASFAVEHYGTVNHKPTLKEIEKRLISL
jgi:adenosine kinase